MCLGILAGGGDCSGLDALIRAPVLHTIRTHQGQMLGFEDGWKGRFESRVRELDLPAITGILPRGGTSLGTSRTDPFRHTGDVQVIGEAFVRHELQGLLVWGGRNLVGGRRPGRRWRSDRGHPQDDHQRRTGQGLRVRLRHDRLPRRPRRTDSLGRPRYGGVGEVLAREIEARLVTETRTVTLGFVQRGGTPTPFDRLLASCMGVTAVDLAVKGTLGRMVSIQGGQITSAELSSIRKGPRPVPAKMLETARVFFG